MVKYPRGDKEGGKDAEWFRENRLNKAFKALMNPKRRAIVAELEKNNDKNKPKNVAHLAASFKISLPALMKHMKALEEGRLVIRSKWGQKTYYVLNHRTFHTMNRWLEPYDKIWRKKIASIAKLTDS